MAILAGNHHKSHDRRDLSRISAFIYYGIFGNQALISRFSVSINLFNIFFVKASSLHLAISLIFRRTKFLILIIFFFFFLFWNSCFFTSDPLQRELVLFCRQACVNLPSRHLVSFGLAIILDPILTEYP